MVTLRSANISLNIVLAGILTVGSAFWSWVYFHENYKPPRRYLSTVVINNPIDPGETITIQSVRDVRRNCPGMATRHVFSIGSDGVETLAFSDMAETNVSQIGDSLALNFKMQTPTNLPCGRYVYRAIVRLECNGRIFTQDVPAAAFQVCK